MRGKNPRRESYIGIYEERGNPSEGKKCVITLKIHPPQRGRGCSCGQRVNDACKMESDTLSEEKV